MSKFSLNSCLFFTFQYITNEGTVFTFKTNLNSPRYKLINIDFSKPEMVSLNSPWYKLINIDFSKPEMISLKHSFVFYPASLLNGAQTFFYFPSLFFVKNLFPRKNIFDDQYIIYWSVASPI